MLRTSPSEDSVELLRETGAAMFVINLCASTTPVTLAHPATAELKRFTFFVTRKREEGRERFRLHMGYFSTLAEAEQMLAVIRDVYPAAWAGPAPEGRGGPPRAAQAKPPMSIVPAPTSVETKPAIESKAVEPATPTMPAVIAPKAVVAATAPTPPSAALGLESMSNVREVLAELADEPRSKATQPPAPAPVARKPAPSKPAVQAPRPATRPTVVPKAVPAPPAAKTAAVEPPTLTPSQMLRVLETPGPAAPLAPAADGASSSTANNIRVLTPEDTQTLRDIKLDAQRNAPTSYAVQLIWAVQPIDMEVLPHLAIFDAYTLYHVEGNRQGRRWYGLRLGFFSDAGAAKQVAQYVRSEYVAVAVVPVTGKERDGARAPTLSAAAVPQGATAPRNETPKIPTVKPLEKPAPTTGLEGFELLPDAPAAAKRDLDDALASSTSPMPPKASGKAPGKRAVVRANRKPAPPGAPQPLESTLEILGASTLTIDESREIVNDAAARHAKAPKKEKAGRFARLLNRLSDKGGKG